MLHKIHSKSKDFLFKGNTRDWHYLLQLGLLTFIISFPFFEVFLPYRQLVFGAISTCYIIYGLLLINKPGPILLVIATFAILIILINYSAINIVGSDLKTQKSFIISELIIVVLYLLFLGMQLLIDTLEARVSRRLIYISMQNYLIIGLIFSYLFELTHIIDPHAFNFSDVSRFNYSYLSFVILSSVGLGDLLPLTNAGKALVVIESIAGQFYLTFFVAIIIGKYLSQPSNDD
jgi:hypothetical protein